MVDPKTAVREYVLGECADTVAEVLRCADRVAESWNDEVSLGGHHRPATTDREAVVEPLSRELRDKDLLAQFPTILSEAVSAGGFSMQSTPVPAPPYVALTSRGPVLRATVSAGRLIVSVRAFDVIRDGGVRYARGTSDPREVVSVELK